MNTFAAELLAVLVTLEMLDARVPSPAKVALHVKCAIVPSATESEGVKITSRANTVLNVPTFDGSTLHSYSARSQIPPSWSTPLVGRPEYPAVDRNRHVRSIAPRWFPSDRQLR